jgi:hypothetical protein
MIIKILLFIGENNSSLLKKFKESMEATAFCEGEEYFKEEKNIIQLFSVFCMLYIKFINEKNNNTNTNITCIFDIEGNFFNSFNKLNNPLSVLKVVEI